MMENNDITPKTEPPPNTERNLNEAANVRYLSADDFVLFKGDGGGLKLTLKDDRSFLRATAKRCFPYSIPNKYVSLRDSNGDEIGIITDLAALGREYRHWIEDELEIRYFTPMITAIRSIKRRYGCIEWNVDTDRGPKKFMTKAIHDTMVEVDSERFLVVDVDENRFELIISALDPTSRGKVEKLF